MSDTIDLLAVGLTTLDIAVHPVERAVSVDESVLVDSIRLSPAGTAGGTAMVAARLGLKVAIASAVGADAQGAVVRAGLESAGIDTAQLQTVDGLPTATTVLPVRADGQRGLYHMLGASILTPLTDGAVARAARTRALHWGGVGYPGMAGQGPGFLATAKAGGALVTCDLIAPRPGALEELAALLPHVDLFMPSLAEVRALMGEAGVAVRHDDLATAAGHFMAMGAGGCVFKLGRDGAMVFTQDGTTHAKAFAIEPVDTTTCGDSFCAGFITGRLNGLDDAACLDLASAVAARVAMGVGTLGALEGLTQTLDFARTAERLA